MGPSNVHELGSNEGISVTNLTLLVPLAGIVASESALFFDSLGVALWLHLLTLGFCVLAPRYVHDADHLFQVLALVPLFRLVNLGMPVFFELTLLWFPLIYAPVVPAVYLVARTRDDVSLQFNWRALVYLLPAAVVVSVVMGMIEYAIVRPDALVPAWDIPNVLLLSVVMIGFVGFVEEALFRGVLQRALEARLGVLPGLLLASALFGLLHAGYHSPVEILFAAGVGLVYGIIYDRTDSLGLITVMHGVLNVTLFGLVPLFPQFRL